MVPDTYFTYLFCLFFLSLIWSDLILQHKRNLNNIKQGVFLYLFEANHCGQEITGRLLLDSQFCSYEYVQGCCCISGLYLLPAYPWSLSFIIFFNGCLFTRWSSLNRIPAPLSVCTQCSTWTPVTRSTPTVTTTTCRSASTQSAGIKQLSLEATQRIWDYIKHLGIFYVHVCFVLC